MEENLYFIDIIELFQKERFIFIESLSVSKKKQFLTNMTQKVVILSNLGVYLSIHKI